MTRFPSNRDMKKLKRLAFVLAAWLETRVVRQHYSRYHMNTKRFALSSALAVSLLLARDCSSASVTNETDSWSAPTNGLQARITLVEKPKEFGTRWIVPYLELRNVRDLNNPLEVCCDRQHIQFELVDATGNAVTNRSVMDRSGPVPDIGNISLPFDSSIRISMECRNWGVPKVAAMISTDSGAWVIEEAERGQVFLRARIVGDRVDGDHYRIWHGKIETPLVRVDWK